APRGSPGTAPRRRAPRGRLPACRSWRAPRDGRDDRQLVAVLDRRGEVVEVADVLVVEVDVDEPAQLPVVEEPGRQAGELAAEVVEHRLHGGAAGLDLLLAICMLPHRRRDLYFD